METCGLTSSGGVRTDKEPIERQADQAEQKRGLLETLAEEEESLSKLVENVATSIDKFISKREKHQRQLETARARYAWRVTAFVLAIIAIAVVVTTLLTYTGAISPEPLIFLLGTVTGSLITFISEWITPLVYPVEEEGE